MGQLSLVAATAVLAFFGWGWVRTVVNWFHHPFNPTARQEQQLQDAGALKADGTVKVDAEFDADLNAINKDLNSAQLQNEADLNTLEK